MRVPRLFRFVSRAGCVLPGGEAPQVEFCIQTCLSPRISTIAADDNAGHNPHGPPASAYYPPEQAAQEYPVRLRAVVACYDSPTSIRGHGALNGSRRLRRRLRSSVPPRPILTIKPGTLVEITGVTAPGDYAAVVDGSRVRMIGQSGMPPNPPDVTLTQLLTGAFDSQWVKVEGRIRSAAYGGPE